MLKLENTSDTKIVYRIEKLRLYLTFYIATTFVGYLFCSVGLSIHVYFHCLVYPLRDTKHARAFCTQICLNKKLNSDEFGYRKHEHAQCINSDNVHRKVMYTKKSIGQFGYTKHDPKLKFETANYS
jgi:hypothetical protein